MGYYALIAELKSGHYGDPEPVLETYLTHSDEYLAMRALVVLFDLDLERAVEHSLPLLSDPKHQFVACQRLATYGGTERSVLPLCDVLWSSEDPDARYMAAEALYLSGDERAIPALEHAQLYDQGCDWEERRISEMAKKAIEAISARLPPETVVCGAVRA